jgi:hypothetical protein
MDWLWTAPIMAVVRGLVSEVSEVSEVSDN